MAQNSLYPGFVKIKYTSNGHTHYQVLPVRAEDLSPGTEPSFLLRDNTTSIAMSTAIDAYVAIIDNLFTDSASIILAEYWNIDSVDADPVFYYVHEIGQPGVGVTAPVTAQQLTVSFRTALGGYMKFAFMEPVGGLASKDDYPFASSAVDALADYMIAPATGWVIGRDGGYLISGLRALTKINDALRKKYVLNL